MPHVLMICTANICRSPVAEGLLRDRLQKRGLTDWTVSSAGTWAQFERGASQNSVIVMQQQYGLDITDHVAHMVEAPDLQQADLVLCMEAGHAEALRAEFPDDAHKVHLLSEMVGVSYSISDPYGGPYTAYYQMAGEVADLVDRGLDRIIKLGQQNAARR